MEIEAASRLAVQNVLKEGLTDIFPLPKEMNLLTNKYFQKHLVEKVAKCIRGNSLESLEIGPIAHVLLPKGGPFDFRRCALIQPLDTIKYLGLVLTLADEIERNRPSVKNHIVFSYRLNPRKGYLFDSRYSIREFRKYTTRYLRLKASKYLVSCDIANFYDRLNIHRLESTLLSMKIDKQRIKQLNELLLFWANRDSFGLPIGSNASRILAEAALIEVDKYMLSIAAKFVRFVDDYRFFAPDVHSAHHWLTQLIERLWLEGLTINMSKSKIEDISELPRSEPQETPKKGAETIPNQGAPGTRTKVKNEIGQPQFRIVAGYGGTIPTRFKVPAAKELNKLKGSNVAAKLRILKKKRLPTPEDITDFVKSIISVGKFDMLVDLPDVLDLFPQFTPYIVDVLCKYNNEISQKNRNAIRDRFAHRLRDTKYLPEYITISYVRLLGAAGYADKITLLDYFRGLHRNAGSYIGRALLDALEDHLTRGEVLEIRSYFIRADAWEKRQILAIVDRHLTEDEKRPWLKNIKTLESKDPFIVERIKPSQRPKRVR